MPVLLSTDAHAASNLMPLDIQHGFLKLLNEHTAWLLCL